MHMTGMTVLEFQVKKIIVYTFGQISDMANCSDMSHVLRKPVYAICEQQRCRSVISAFVVHCLDSIIPLVSISAISRL